MPPSLLDVQNLTVRFATRSGTVEAVRGIDLKLHAGETLAIVGESGSGKSQAMMALCGLLANNGSAEGSVRFDGGETVAIDASPLRKALGKSVTLIFQEPMTSLDPLRRIGDQFTALIRRHSSTTAAEARARAVEMLRLVQIPEPEMKIRSYPHELSGGQRQRVMIAMALVHGPKLLIADEPTTALDVTVQADIIALLKTLQTQFGMAIIFISHDLNLVGRFADRVMVMRHGLVVETGTTQAIFSHPKAEYTRLLLESEPRGRKAPIRQDSPVLLEAKDVTVRFKQRGALFGKSPPDLVAVDTASLTLRVGETLGIVGESGSGKSTFGRALLGLLPCQGSVTFQGQRIDGQPRASLRPMRRDMQVVFQDPFGSLSPRMTVGDIIAEGLTVHEPRLTRAVRNARIHEALDQVKLDPAMRNRYPHEFSGGQRQRIAIARAVILKPALLLLDEPTSALDRTVQSSIIDLLRELQALHGMSYLFISHDLAVVRALADRVLVMKSGRVIESGSVDALFQAPRESYTQALLKAAFLQDEKEAVT